MENWFNWYLSITNIPLISNMVAICLTKNAVILEYLKSCIVSIYVMLSLLEY